MIFKRKNNHPSIIWLPPGTYYTYLVNFTHFFHWKSFVSRSKNGKKLQLKKPGAKYFEGRVALLFEENGLLATCHSKWRIWPRCSLYGNNHQKDPPILMTVNDVLYIIWRHFIHWLNIGAGNSITLENINPSLASSWHKCINNSQKLQ